MEGGSAGRRVAMLAALMMLPLSSCVSSVYACAENDQCPSGVCEPTGFCSFEDGECESGRRYGDFAGGGLAGTCVEQPGTSSGADGSTSTTLPDVMSTSSSGSESSGSSTTTSGVVPMTSTDGESSSTGTPSDTTNSEESSSSGGLPVMRVEEGLVVQYRLTEGKGTTVFDSAPLDPPIDLTLTGGGYEWTPDGLRFLGSNGTIASSTTSTTKIYQACQATEEITVEAWVTPEAIDTNGPPRIITFSENSARRNYSLMVGRNIDGTSPPALRGRLRVDAMEVNGSPDTTFFIDESGNGQLGHVVFRHADGVDQIYVNASLVEETPRVGDFSVWDTSGVMQVALGNENGSESRPLTGTIHLAATYCRALSEEEIIQNFDAGF